MNDPRTAHFAALSALLPGLAAYWESNAYYNDSDTDRHTLAGLFGDASQVTKELLSAGHTDYVQGLLAYIETVMNSGTSDEREAASTCFLENLLNVTPSDIDPKLWIPYLGPESRAFCRAWDDFTGCRTEYLHEAAASDNNVAE